MKTKRKLEEAHYFLEQMEVNCYEPDKLQFNLSAFVSSSRSVLWIMRNEFHSHVGWDGWFNSRDLSPKEETFFRGIKNIRNHSQKVGPLYIKRYLELTIAENDMDEKLNSFLNENLGQNIELDVTLGNEDDPVPLLENDRKLKFKSKISHVYLGIDEFPDENIIDICKKYYALIEIIVNECYEKYHSLDPGQKTVKGS